MGKMQSVRIDEVMGQWPRREVQARCAMTPAWRDVDERKPGRGLKRGHIRDAARERQGHGFSVDVTDNGPVRGRWRGTGRLALGWMTGHRR